jgi:hypothetical protein
VLVPLVVAVVVFALPAAASAAADPNLGYDISYPQCNAAFPGGGAFGIAGVNGGRPFGPNPCLGTGDGASELSWAGASAALYANTADPGPALSTHWPNGQSSPKECNTAANPGSDTPECHYDYGWNAAADSYQDAVNAYLSLGWAPSGAARTPVANQWWLDVETANSWTSTPSLNVQALRGEVDYLSSVGAAGVGFYSSAGDWQTITGSTTAFSADPAWLAGASSLSDAQTRCRAAGFTGGASALVQFVSGGFDDDYRCALQSALAFSSAPVTVTAGQPSSPITIELPTAPAAPVMITLSSSSATGSFSPGATVTIPAGSTTASFSYSDTKAGDPTLTAGASGYTSAAQAETVSAAAPVTLVVSPRSVSVALGGTQTFTASAVDSYGNPVAVDPAWSVGAGTPGSVSPLSGASTNFRASSTSSGNGSVVATSGSLSASASLTVAAPQLRVTSIVYSLTSTGRLAIKVSVARVSDGSPVPGATISFTLWRGSTSVASATLTTGPTGKATYKTLGPVTSGCYTTTIASITAAGLSWDGVTPTNQYCR